MLTVDLDRMAFKNGERVLDLGCGQGRHIHSIYGRKDIEAVAIDLSYDDVKKTQEGFSLFREDEVKHKPVVVLAVADAARLPFTDASLDKVVCSEVLEHIHDYETVIAEILRILKPGGLLAISVPREWPEWVCWKLSADYHNTPGGHIRIFNATSLKQTIESSGFKFLGRHWAHALHVPFWWLKCIFWNRRETLWLIRQYQKLLVWDLMKQPRVTRFLENLLNPIMGKSIVFYFSKGFRS